MRNPTQRPGMGERRAAHLGSDALIAQLIQNHQSDRAFHELLRTLGPELRGYLRGTIASDSDGDEIFQELCIALWKGLGDFRGGSSLRSWAYAIAHNLTASMLRRYSRRNFVRLDTLRRDALMSPSLRSLCSRQRRENALVLARDHLTPAEREILILRVERGLDFAEVAVVLCTSEETARKRFQRAKDHLRSLIASVQS